MQEKSLIKKNILQLLELENVTKYKFYERTGITRGVLDQNNGMSEDNIARFLAAYPNISLDWLLKGEGEIYKDQNISSTKSENGQKPANVAEPAGIYMNDELILSAKDETIATLKNSLEEAIKDKNIYRNLIESKFFNK